MTAIDDGFEDGFVDEGLMSLNDQKTGSWEALVGREMHQRSRANAGSQLPQRSGGFRH